MKSKRPLLKRISLTQFFNSSQQEQITFNSLEVSLAADPLLGGDVWASAQTGVGALRKRFETTPTTACKLVQRQRSMARRPVDPPPLRPLGVTPLQRRGSCSHHFYYNLSFNILARYNFGQGKTFQGAEPDTNIPTSFRPF